LLEHGLQNGQQLGSTEVRLHSRDVRICDLQSQSDKEQFARTTMMRLQQQQLLIRTKLDRAYDDRLGRQISEELWSSKSAELEADLQRVRAEMARHEQPSHEYETTGLQILELAQSAYSLYVTQNPPGQARLVKRFRKARISESRRKPRDCVRWPREWRPTTHRPRRAW
jgi:hypothetical protein